MRVGFETMKPIEQNNNNTHFEEGGYDESSTFFPRRNPVCKRERVQKCADDDGSSSTDLMYALFYVRRARNRSMRT